MRSLWHDIRFASRMLRKSPVFTSVAVLTLALGIGANTAIFTVVDAVLFRPLPYENPDQLALLWNRMANAGPQKVPIAAPDVAHYQEHSRLFAGFAFTNRISDAALTSGAHPAHIRLGQVTPNFFSLLGIQAALGRTFVPGEDILPPELLNDSTAIIPPPSLILSDGLWERGFGADTAILHKTIEIDGRPGTVVGVLPAGFELLMPPDAGIARDVDVWAPVRVELSRLRRAQGLRDQDSDNTGAVIGRLKRGVGIERAQAEMDAIAAAQREDIPFYRNAGMRIDVYPMHTDVVAHARPVLIALFGAVAFVLLIACINVANLLLARASGRSREMAIRSALGAGRGRIIRQMLTESGLLALFGGATGLLLAVWGIDLLMALSPANLPRAQAIDINGTVLIFTLVATALAAFLFGLAPAFDLSLRKGSILLNERGADVAGRRSRLRSALVASEVGLSLVLLVGAGLMLKSFAHLQDVRPGFDSEGVLAFNLSLRYPNQFQGPAARARFIRQLEERISGLPGVQAVGLVGRLPLGGRIWTQPYGLEGQSAEEWSANEADFRMISSGYFSAMGTRLLAGRFFTEVEDLFENERVVIIDERMARRVAPDGNAIGKRLGFPLDGAPIWAEIVGIVEHVRHETLREEGRETLYVPYRQEASRDIAMVVKATGDPENLVAPIRREVQALAAFLPIYNVQPMAELVAESMAPTRFALLLIGIFAAVALALAIVGLYGVISYSVSQRTQEIGIRMALGARGRDLLQEVVGKGMALAAIGLVIGFAVSAIASRTLSSLLFGVQPTDLTTYASVSLLLAIVVFLACYLPARRASRVDPVDALRYE